MSTFGRWRYYTLSGGNLVISPDAKKIAFLGLGADAPEGGGKPFYDLYVINADGSGLTNLSDKVTRYNKATGANVSVDYLGRHLFSPDSKQIAFVRSSYVPTRSVPLPSYDYDLYAVNVDGTDLTRLTNTEDWEGIITWVWK